MLGAGGKRLGTQISGQMGFSPEKNTAAFKVWVSGAPTFDGEMMDLSLNELKHKLQLSNMNVSNCDPWPASTSPSSEK